MLAASPITDVFHDKDALLEIPLDNISSQKGKKKGPAKSKKDKKQLTLIEPLEISNLTSELNQEEEIKTPPTQKLTTSFGVARTSVPISIPFAVEQVYKLVRKSNGGLGGNGYDGAIYGELTMGSMQKVLNYMVSNCELTHKSRFIDVGSGLGKPNFHAAQFPRCRLSIGVELENIRWKLGMHNLHCILPHILSSQPFRQVKKEEDSENIPPQTNIVPESNPTSDLTKQPVRGRGRAKKTPPSTTPTPLSAPVPTPPQPPISPSKPSLPSFDALSSPLSSLPEALQALKLQAAPEKWLNGGVNFICDDIDSCQSLDPFTHVYQFDLGFPPPLQQSIARKFNRSVHCRYLISYRPPYRVIPEYGYEVDFLHQMLTSMHGSGEGHTAYFYKKRVINSAPAKEVLGVTHKVRVPARPCAFPSDPANPNSPLEDEQDEEIWCDQAFKQAVELAVGETERLIEAVEKAERESLESGRPKRERKPRVFN